MKTLNRVLALALILAALLPLQAFAACTTGQTTCNTDTVNDAALVAAINDPTVANRVYELWLQYCFNNVWAEAASTAGNLNRIVKCRQIIDAGPRLSLVALVLNAITIPEILSTSCPPTAVGTLGTSAGCLVDVDVNNTIATLMTDTVSSASPTATAASGSTVLTVSSATGITPGQSVSGAGIPGGATVLSVSGTSVAISLATTAALSATTVLFTVSIGLP